MMFPSRASQHLNLLSASLQSNNNNGATTNDLQSSSAASSRTPLAAAPVPANLTVQDLLEDARRRSQVLPLMGSSRPALPTSVLSAPSLATSLLPHSPDTVRRMDLDAQLLTRSRQLADNARLINDAIRIEREAAIQALLQSEQQQRLLEAQRRESLADQLWGGIRHSERAGLPPAATWPLVAASSGLVCGAATPTVGGADDIFTNAALRHRLLASSQFSAGAALTNRLASTPSPTSHHARVGSPRFAALPTAREHPQSPASSMDKKMPAKASLQQVVPEPTKAPLPNALGIEQDTNWLSQNQCVLRAEFIEVAKATRNDFSGLDGGSDAQSYEQVGIRCRYCAHAPTGQRASRSSAFPSSITQLYQSFTMMQRDHFHKCTMIPLEQRRHLETLRRSNTQGACDSKQYWTYAAKTLGMFDTPRGIEMNQQAVEAGRQMPNFGVGEAVAVKEDSKVSSLDQKQKVDNGEHLLLQFCSTDAKLPAYLGHLLTQLQVVTLLPSEKTGKRKALPIGFTGLGCKCCSKAGRLGFSRTFPLRRRTLPAKLDDMLSHLLRCPLTPSHIKSELLLLQGGNDERKRLYQKHHAKLDELWKVMGREGDFCA
ncbi:expressed unknown protein [Seminavis robusta]|uniref:Uncharacterized protein n=1 Tax=Seminavis robusta TaxID=568900 RepID=A0A9N8DS61_9STRA|nr:expressed unknown protein [Seminavis robusta]|eukprot:Sro242_g096580.1 n/a (601) ;mRNA; r:23081-25074